VNYHLENAKSLRALFYNVKLSVSMRNDVKI